jgi:hypothetical protein
MNNKNSGYGRLMADYLPYNVSPGKIFVVAKAGLAYRDILSDIFDVDTQGTVRVFATVDAAIGACTASAGDTIFVMPGHTETVTATSIAHDVAGVNIIGLGQGDFRPTFTFGAAAATITVSAANGSWKNCRFIANFADVASAFTLTTATGFVIEGNDFIDTSSILNFLCCVTTSATNNQSDGLKFNKNYVYGLAATDGACVSILANELRLEVNDNIVDKAATNDAGHLVTLSSKIVGGVRILRNILTVVGSSGGAAAVALTGSGSTSSGVFGFNNVMSLDTTGGLIMTASTGIRPMQNYLSGAADKSGTLIPTADDPA